MYYFQYFVSSSDASVFLKTNKKKLLLSLCFVFTVYKYIGNDLYDTAHYGRAIKEILHFLAAVNKCVSGNFYPLDPYLSLSLSGCVRAGARASLNKSVFSKTTTWGRQIMLSFLLRFTFKGRSSSTRLEGSVGWSQNLPWKRCGVGALCDVTEGRLPAPF